MKNSNLYLCDATVHPGEIANFALPLPEQYSCAPLYMPIKVIHGKEKGPCLVVFSTLKGNELNGIEIVNQIVDLIEKEHIKGTIIAIPVVNVYGLTHFPMSLPHEGSLINCFPGKENGKFGERLAYIFTQEIMKKADYVIELQTGDLNHNILPQIYCNFDDMRAKQLANAFHPPVVNNVRTSNNKFRETAENMHIPLLVYQAGEAMRFDESAISVGVEGIMNVLRYIDILPKTEESKTKPIFSQNEKWIAAPKGGIFHTNITLGQVIKERDVLGKITNPFGAPTIEKVFSPQDGVVIGINTSPLVHEGMPLVKIASFVDDDKAENLIEEWNKKQSFS